MTRLIATPLNQELRVAQIGRIPESFASHFGPASATLDQADAAIFAFSSRTGLTEEGIALWQEARELYIPSLILITELSDGEIDFDDMAAIAGKTLDPVVTPYLVLHGDGGEPAALIDLDTLKIINYHNGERVMGESDPEHKLLVFEFRKEYLEAIEAAGEAAFENGLLYPALPYYPAIGLGIAETIEYLNRVPILR